MKILMTIIYEEYPADGKLPEPELFELNEGNMMNWINFIYLGLANGIYTELCVDSDDREGIEICRGLFMGAGSARLIEVAESRKRDLWLYREGYECYQQTDEGHFFLNPEPRPELFEGDSLEEYKRGFSFHLDRTDSTDI